MNVVVVLIVVCFVGSHSQRSIRARSRQERRAEKDKVALEKNRINQRTGYAARMQRENAPATSAGLTTCAEGGAGYMNDADRFHSDTAGEEYQRRQETLAKKQRALEFRRNQAVNREDDRYNRLEEKRRDEEVSLLPAWLLVCLTVCLFACLITLLSHMNRKNGIDFVRMVRRQ